MITKSTVTRRRVPNIGGEDKTEELRQKKKATRESGGPVDEVARLGPA
jgi:hypothetical protein